ncbi:MAG: hypothetical protein KatS3mg054_0161 [Chloroflexus sp.]|nr:MAG: hypothetical protein KatS3mg054_0161 [Chloroflexus sp.]
MSEAKDLILRRLTEACIRDVRATVRELAAEGLEQGFMPSGQMILAAVEATGDFSSVLASVFAERLSEAGQKALEPDPLGREEGVTAQGLYEAAVFLSEMISDMHAVVSRSAVFDGPGSEEAKVAFRLVCLSLAHKASAMRLKATAMEALAAATSLI